MGVVRFNHRMRKIHLHTPHPNLPPTRGKEFRVEIKSTT